LKKLPLIGSDTFEEWFTESNRGERAASRKKHHKAQRKAIDNEEKCTHEEPCDTRKWEQGRGKDSLGLTGLEGINTACGVIVFTNRKLSDSFERIIAMDKIISIIKLIIELINTIRGKATDTSDKNVSTIRTGLDLAPENDPEVANAKHRLEQIAALPEKQRKARASEIREMEQLVEKKRVIPKTASDKKTLLDQIREAEGKKP